MVADIALSGVCEPVNRGETKKPPALDGVAGARSSP